MTEPGVVFDRKTADILLEMARQFMAAGGKLPAMGRRSSRGPRAGGDLQLAVLAADINKGESGDVTLLCGKEKGDEEETQTVPAYNRMFGTLPAETQVNLSWQGGGWEIVQVVADDCLSLADPTALDGYVEGVDLVPVFGADGCWKFVELGDC